jgi:hypothetical protein
VALLNLHVKLDGSWDVTRLLHVAYQVPIAIMQAPGSCSRAVPGIRYTYSTNFAARNAKVQPWMRRRCPRASDCKDRAS